MTREHQDAAKEAEAREREEFEAHVYRKLQERGIAARPMGGRPPEHRCGNLLGIDIVFDSLMKERNGVYIETRAWEIPHIPILFKSTLFRDSGAWLYGVGDYETFFIFGKKSLRRAILEPGRHFRRRRGPMQCGGKTGVGIVLPFEQAESLAEITIHFNKIF